MADDNQATNNNSTDEGGSSSHANSSNSNTTDSPTKKQQQQQEGDSNSDNSGLVSLGMNGFGFAFESESGGEQRTAEQAVAELGSIMKMTYPKEDDDEDEDGVIPDAAAAAAHEQQITDLGNSIFGTAATTTEQQQDIRKRKPDEQEPLDASMNVNSRDDGSDAGYKSDTEGGAGMDASTGGNNNSKPRKKKKLDNRKREERNQREKERSFRISKQITDLRNLLSSGGIVVPKGTKSSVLTEAANYIRILQQHQYRSEIDRHQLIQQMQLIGGGAHGPQAAQAVRHFAAQNGVWSLGNFGGVPPKSAMGFYSSGNSSSGNNSGTDTSSGGNGGAVTTTETTSSCDPTTDAAPSCESNVFSQSNVDPSEYRFIFNSCGVGMAVASMGGAFIDCNQLFCQLSQYTNQEVISMTIFNLTDRQDLQRAFDSISQLISPPIRLNEASATACASAPKAEEESTTVTFKAAMKNNNRDDLSLCVSLVKGEDGVAKCFCVTLVKTPRMVEGQLVAASFESIQTAPPATIKDDSNSGEMNQHATAPAFTSG